MSLHDWPRPRKRGFWRAVRQEVGEVAWLVGIVCALSVAAVAVAVILAGAQFY
jgi:hypothetical protein